MTSEKQAQESEVTLPALSKRGARRAIQRAFVRVGRERAIRQHLREAELTTLWTIEDWGFEGCSRRRAAESQALGQD